MKNYCILIKKKCVSSESEASKVVLDFSNPSPMIS